MSNFNIVRSRKDEDFSPALSQATPDLRSAVVTELSDDQLTEVNGGIPTGGGPYGDSFPPLPKGLSNVAVQAILGVQKRE